METAPKRQCLSGMQLQPEHAAAARKMLCGIPGRSATSSNSSSSSSSSDDDCSGSNSSDPGAPKHQPAPSKDAEDVRVGDCNLLELLRGEYVHPSVRCAAVEGKALGLVLRHPVPAGTLLLRSVGLRVVPEADGASVCLSGVFGSLDALAKARPRVHQRLLHRFAMMAPRPIRQLDRDAYVAKQSVAGALPEATVEQRRVLYEQWLGKLICGASECGLATGADALDFLVRLSHNIFDEGASAGAALLNHSCAPNVAMSCILGELDPHPDSEQGQSEVDKILCSFDVWSVEDMDAGAELSPSYLSLDEQLLPTAERRAKLEKWGFRCNCARCSNHARESFLTAVRCLECETGHCTSVGPNQDRFAECVVCGCSPPSSERISDLLRSTNRALDDIDAYEGDPETQWLKLRSVYEHLTEPRAVRSDSDSKSNSSPSGTVQLHPRHWLMTRLHLRVAAAARDLLPALRPALESDDPSLVEHATQVFRHTLLGLVIHLRTALTAVVQVCSPHDRLVGSVRSRLASALQNAANEPAVALHAYTVLPNSQEAALEAGSDEERALAVRRCREEAVAHERAAIAIEKLNPRKARGAGAAQDLMGMLPRGTFG